MNTVKSIIKLAGIHLTGILIYLALPFVFTPEKINYDLLSSRFFQREMVTFSLLIFIFYFQYYLFIPRLLFKGKQVRYVIWTLVGLILTFILIELFFQELKPEKPLINAKIKPIHLHKWPRRNFEIMEFGRILFNYAFVIGAALVIRIFSRNKEIEKEKAELELKYLQEQINPHFLFNTINGIYSLSIIENASKTSDAILQLSDILRFTFNDSQQERITIKKEVEYIKSYIDLQKIRCSAKTEVIFKAEIADNKVVIAPLMLISFVENAFKYGVSPEQNSTISVNIELDTNDRLDVSIYNDKVQIQNQHTHGIGISNARKRLESIYPGRHQLTIEDKESSYYVHLMIEL